MPPIHQTAADAALRRLAEQRLQATLADADGTPWDVDTARLVHELQVHQIELELQNDELIAARAEAEAALLRYSDLYDFAPVGYITLARNGAIEQINLHGARLLGAARADVVGRRLRSFVAAASLTRYKAFVERVFACSDPQHCELTLDREGSGPLHLQIEASCAVGGTVCRIAMIDMTERDQAEAALVAVADQLRESQKMESLGTLAGGVAHDFNNILSSIIGNVSLAQELLEPGHPVAECLLEIHRAGSRATLLVRQILTLSQRQRQELSVLQLGPVVEEAIRLLRATIPAGIGITTTIDPDAPRLLADASQMHQIVMNLGTNAWLALRDWPERPAEARRIDFRVEGCSLDAAGARALTGGLLPGRYVRLSVRDNGCGMAPEIQPHIFEPFYTTRAVGEGTGLGLSVVYGIVGAHHGTIAVHSALGEGSSFDVYFPAAPIVAAAAALPLAAPGAAPGTRPTMQRHLLYIDDELQLVSMVTRLLQREGHRVTGFADARQALGALRSDPHSFDLMVTDFNMPVLSGLDVAREAKALRPDLPVLIASGYITKELEHEAQLLDVHSLLYKPVMVPELRRVMRELFAGAE
ncbi:MAG: ATP-binding protein [Gemmatimonadota bacterium]